MAFVAIESDNYHTVTAYAFDGDFIDQIEKLAGIEAHFTLAASSDPKYLPTIKSAVAL